jgi:3-oxoacyl-[acyl-carrier protein] reductase
VLASEEEAQMDSSFSLEGRVALVTGASKGFGRAIAEGFVKAGAAVGILARTEADLVKAAKDMSAGGGRVLPLPADGTDRAQVQRAVDTLAREFGPADVLVNNIGGSRGQGFVSQKLLDIDDENFDNCIRFNLKSTLYAAQCVAPAMLKRGRGSIINVATMVARPYMMPQSGRAAYIAAKAGVLMLTQAMATEWAPAIRVNCIAPGQVMSEGTFVRATDAHREAILARMAMGRPGSGADGAGAALFLASDASYWITGITIDVNGGAGLTTVFDPFAHRAA